MRGAPLVRSRGYTGAWGPNLNGGMGGLMDDPHYLYMGMRPPAGFQQVGLVLPQIINARHKKVPAAEFLGEEFRKRVKLFCE